MKQLKDYSNRNFTGCCLLCISIPVQRSDGECQSHWTYKKRENYDMTVAVTALQTFRNIEALPDKVMTEFTHRKQLNLISFM